MDFGRRVTSLFVLADLSRQFCRSLDSRSDLIAEKDRSAFTLLVYSHSPVKINFSDRPPAISRDPNIQFCHESQICDAGIINVYTHVLISRVKSDKWVCIHVFRIPELMRLRGPDCPPQHVIELATVVRERKRVAEIRRLRRRFTTVMDNVLRLLRQSGSVITCYNALIILYWLHIDKAEISLRNCKGLTSAQTIERSLRELIENELVPEPLWLSKRRQQERTHRAVL